MRDVNLSHLGVAVKNCSGKMVSYDKTNDTIVDVELLNFDAKNMIFALPVATSAIAVGDVIKHNGKLVFVTSIENGIQVVDVTEGEKKTILPTKSMFGFDFVTKVSTFLDFSGANASADNPFGNLLPLMLIGNSENKGSKMDMLLPLMLMSNSKDSKDNNMFASLDMSNPLMLMALMGGSESNDFFLPLMLMSASQNGAKEKK
jgi:hypothetical protein